MGKKNKIFEEQEAALEEFEKVLKDNRDYEKEQNCKITEHCSVMVLDKKAYLEFLNERSRENGGIKIGCPFEPCALGKVEKYPTSG